MSESLNHQGYLTTFENWGLIDAEGNLAQKDGIHFKGRVLEKVSDADKDKQIKYYVEKFQSLEKIFVELKEEFDKNINKKITLEKVAKFLAFIERAAAIGDFDTLITQTKEIQSSILEEFSKNLALKEDICKKVAFFIQSNEFSIPVSVIKQIKEDFALIGYVSEDRKNLIQDKFKSLIDEYFAKRSEFKDEQEQIRYQNLEAKKALCVEAENLSDSENWKETAEQYKELQMKWKEIGDVPIDYINDIWERFKSANDAFFARRQNYYDEQDQIRRDNLALKEKLCEQAETLQNSDSWVETTQKLINLQKAWKEIGPVPREENDTIWDRFKKANDAFFARKTDFIIQDKNQRLANLKIKQLLCDQVEELSLLKGFDSTKSQVEELKERWIQTGPVPVDESEEIGRRFSEACRNAMRD